MWVSLTIRGLMLVDALDRLVRRFDVDLCEGDMLPDRWVAWGTITCGYLPEHRNPRFDRRYFAVQLPSYGYNQVGDGLYQWSRRGLLWLGPLADRSIWNGHRGWCSTWYPVPGHKAERWISWSVVNDPTRW